LCDGGVDAEAFKQVVAAQPGFKLGELGVGLDQVVAGALGAFMADRPYLRPWLKRRLLYRILWLCASLGGRL